MKSLTLALLLVCGLSADSCTVVRAAGPAQFTLPDTDDGLPGTGTIRRYEWFKNLWQQRRANWAVKVAQDQGAVVFLGDSIIQGWGDDLGGDFPGMKSANRGISGDTTRGVLIRMDDDVLALKPAGVVLLIGTNDLEEGDEPEIVAANMKLILAKLREHRADLSVILCKVFPSSESKKRPAPRIKQINSLYESLAKGDPHTLVLETWLPFANEHGDARPEEFPDLLHPNRAGYAKWAGALRPLLETLELLPVAEADFQPEPGFVSLFNGRDLTGWGYRVTPESDKQAAANWRKNDPNAPPWPFRDQPVHFDGATASDDGRYRVRNGRLVVAIPPEGRKIQQLYTRREFAGDFVLKLEFRATPNADSGVFLRGPQLQCRDYLLAGPYKQLQKYRPLDWNEMEVSVSGGTARCTVNGEVIEAEFKVPPAPGPIGLEGDRGQMEYRRIRVKMSDN
ncbi:MAG TPA: G-D-S-L family lipolytic protein [Verrucomicrobiales bacterium]|nr:G-D-S-L family lipolytic protein [Verrucomicrobiales bacterium]